MSRQEKDLPAPLRYTLADALRWTREEEDLVRLKRHLYDSASSIVAEYGTTIQSQSYVTHYTSVVDFTFAGKKAGVQFEDNLEFDKQTRKYNKTGIAMKFIVPELKRNIKLYIFKPGSWTEPHSILRYDGKEVDSTVEATDIRDGLRYCRGELEKIKMANLATEHQFQGSSYQE